MENKLRQKLGRSLIMGTHVTMSDSVSPEILGYAGFDFIWIDTEHTPFDYHTLRHHLDAVKLTGSASVVRVAVGNPSHLKRVIDLGPDGIVFPMINTADEAMEAMKLCIYPPEGTRGFGPLRAVRYGYDSEEEYVKNHKESLVRLIQVETIQAVRELPKIVKNPYIDGYIIGANDLSGSLGELGNVFGERTTRAVKEIAAILGEAGKPLGISTYSTDPDVLKYWYDMGIHMISAGVDFGYIREGAASNLKNLKHLVERQERAGSGI